MLSYRDFFVVSLSINLIACGILIDSDSDQKSDLGFQCTFNEYIELEELGESKVIDYCPFNGNKLQIGDVTDVLIDNCNFATCDTSHPGSERVGLFQHFFDCEGGKEACYYDGWTLSNCFKFKQGLSICECKNGYVECRKNRFQ